MLKKIFKRYIEKLLRTNIYECGNSNKYRLQLSYRSCTPDTVGDPLLGLFFDKGSEELDIKLNTMAKSFDQ